jgi:hypothetical protein
MPEFIKEQFGKGLSETLVGSSVKHQKYGDGVITKVEVADVDEDNREANLITLITFGTEVKSFLLKAALKAKTLEFETETLKSVEKALENLQHIIDMRSVDAEKAIQEELEEQIKAKEKAELEIRKQKEELKAKARQAKMLKKLKELKPEDTKSLFDTPKTYYEILGWMAKHCTSVRAAMPDWMEKQFVAMFGDVDRYVVNLKKKTSGGFDYQWGLGLKIIFDKEIVGPLEVRATSKNKRIIDNVAFVWDLVDTCGFKFGKEQDIDKIIDEVPGQYLEDFKKGFAM